jgi:hypothetical protein
MKNFQKKAVNRLFLVHLDLKQSGWVIHFNYGLRK